MGKKTYRRPLVWWFSLVSGSGINSNSVEEDYKCENFLGLLFFVSIPGS